MYRIWKWDQRWQRNCRKWNCDTWNAMTDLYKSGKIRNTLSNRWKCQHVLIILNTGCFPAGTSSANRSLVAGFISIVPAILSLTFFFIYRSFWTDESILYLPSWFLSIFKYMCQIFKHIVNRKSSIFISGMRLYQECVMNALITANNCIREKSCRNPSYISLFTCIISGKTG